MTVDYSDQTIYSHALGTIPGGEWLEDKINFHMMVPELQTPTYYIENGKLSPNSPIPWKEHMHESYAWFIKVLCLKSLRFNPSASILEDILSFIITYLAGVR